MGTEDVATEILDPRSLPPTPPSDPHGPAPSQRGSNPTIDPVVSARMRSSVGSSSTVGSPMEALERDEIMRTRKFCVIAVVVATAGAVAAMLLPGDPTATAIVLSGVGMAYVAIAFLWWRARDPMQFRRPSTGLGWFVPAVAVTTCIPFFGVYSPAPMVLVLGVYFTGLGKSSRLAYAVYLVCAGVQLVTALLVILRLTHDTGIITVGLTTRNEIIIQALVQFVMLATFVTARMSRRTALVAVGELERAVRIAAHREALLLEAREELERALASGKGRFTGQTLSGYELGSVIGRGAMGEVYEAQDPRGGGSVAIKLLSQASLGNPQHVMRFLRELRTVAGIISPHVVRVIEVGEKPVPYLVMERLEGMTLGELLKGKRFMSAGEVGDLVLQIGAGITAAAACGVVHRDLKPQNLFLHRGEWKILDFGVARAMDQGDTLTSGHVVGTPSYMAPEQAAGGQVDHCTDLYALAAIAYRCLTGQPPYVGGEIAETLYRVVHTRPKRPTEIAPHLRVDVDLVLAIGLARRPGERFSAAIDFAGALVDALDGRLSPELRTRGEHLIRGGAWTQSMVRPSTARIRGPAH
ncbi:MAG: serine/threonine protein kinase [Deltaproteobacteria bacterium]|nr:serine/threonine protein kinase [Deltaproteobacteria bacterium]